MSRRLPPDRGRLRALLTFLALALLACRAPAPPLAAEGMIAVPGGDSLHYRMIGAGPDTVLFLAGGPMLGVGYLQQAFGRLGDRHALLFLDLRGRGESPAVRSADALRLETDATDLEAVRQHFQLERFAAVGHHWGTAVLLKHALRFPGHLTRSVLLAPFPQRANFVFELIRQPHDTAAQRRHGLARAARADTTDPAGYCRAYWGFALSPIEETDPAVVRALAPAVCAGDPARLLAREGEQRRFYQAIGTWNWWDSIPRLGGEALVLLGDGSPILAWGARGWAGRLPGSHLLVVPGSALFPWVRSPAVVEEAVRGFLAGRVPVDARRVDAPPDTLLAQHE